MVPFHNGLLDEEISLRVLNIVGTPSHPLADKLSWTVTRTQIDGLHIIRVKYAVRFRIYTQVHMITSKTTQTTSHNWKRLREQRTMVPCWYIACNYHHCMRFNNTLLFPPEEKEKRRRRRENSTLTAVKTVKSNFGVIDSIKILSIPYSKKNFQLIFMKNQPFLHLDIIGIIQMKQFIERLIT